MQSQDSWPARFVESAERFAHFYSGVARVLQDDDDDDLAFLAEAFATLKDGTRGGAVRLEWAALAVTAGWDVEGPGDVEICHALDRLLKRIGAAELTVEQIDAILATTDDDEAVAVTR